MAFAPYPPFHTLIAAEAELGRDVGADWNNFYLRLAAGATAQQAFHYLQAERDERLVMLTAAELRGLAARKPTQA